MKKFLICILTAMLAVNFMPVSALEKSIMSLDDDANIDNAGPVYQIEYNGEEATVYYGTNGIDIVTEQQTIIGKSIQMGI